MFDKVETVGELIERLQEFPEETPVAIGYNYGDHWNTTVAPSIVAVEEVVVENSEYHRMDIVSSDQEYDCYEAKRAVVISTINLEV